MRRKLYSHIAVILFLSIPLFTTSWLQEDTGYVKPHYQAFQPGEKLEYIIHYGPVNAGAATFRVQDSFIDIGGREHYKLTVFGRSLKGWDWFYKVRDYYYSYMDTKTLLPTVAMRDVREGDYETKEKLIFKQQQNVVISNGKRHEVAGKMFDILSAIYYARCIDLNRIEPGTMIPINTFFADSLFPVGATYLGKGEVKTQLGKFKCRIVKPQLVKGRIFKGQDDMTVYVSDDKNQVPLRIESAIFVGYIQVDLRKFKNLKYPLTSRID